MKPTEPVPRDLLELVQKMAPPEADVVPLSGPTRTKITTLPS